MGKSKLFFVVVVSLILFSLSGCGVFSGNWLRITIDPGRELFDRNFVDIFIDNSRQTSKRYEDGEVALVRFRENVPDGIEFKHWRLPDGTTSRDKELYLYMNSGKRITAVFDLKQGVVVVGDDNKPVYNHLLTPENAFKESGKSLVFLPGNYSGNFDILTPLRSIETLRGKDTTKIYGSISVKSIGFNLMEGFTFIPHSSNPSIIFPYNVEREIIIRDNNFQVGEGVVFKGEIDRSITFDRNLFQGENGITFEGKIYSPINIQTNTFRSNYGIGFFEDIEGEIKITDRNEFLGGQEGILLLGSPGKKLTVDRNRFLENGAAISIGSELRGEIQLTRNYFGKVHIGVLFNQDVVYIGDILIQGNTIEKASFSGIEFFDYVSAIHPSLKIVENNFLNCSNESVNAIGIFFEKFGKIDAFKYDPNNDPYIRNNNFSGNDYSLGVGIDIFGLDTTGFILDSRYNWWGSINGPGDYPGDREGYVPFKEERIIVEPWLNQAYSN